MLQQIISYFILAAGIIYGAAFIIANRRESTAFNEAPGNMKTLGIGEALLFIIASMGVPDFVMQTILGKRMGIITDRELPGTVVGCSIVPGTILAFAMLRSKGNADLKTLIFCGIGTLLGSFLGSKLITTMDGNLIKKIMRIALILSLLFLLGRMLATGGEIGTKSGLTGIQLYLSAALCFVIGLINMFGIPMKPTRSALFLVLGMSPIATLTMVLVLGSLAPISGGYQVLRNGNYQRKMVVASVIFGSLGAIIGAFLAISIPAILLNIVLIAVMLLAIAVMFRD